MNEEDLRAQINSLIRDEIQENINDYIDSKETSGIGFIEEDELKVNISQREIDKIIKDYKRIKKSQRSNLSHVKKLGLVDKHGNPLK